MGSVEGYEFNFLLLNNYLKYAQNINKIFTMYIHSLFVPTISILCQGYLVEYKLIGRPIQ